ERIGTQLLKLHNHIPIKLHVHLRSKKMMCLYKIPQHLG
ncbi:hypothetical protein CP082626L3_0217B, partial [Chlamydia psittaci 08-2626_L3]